MRARSKDLVPVTTAVVIAVVSSATLFFMEFSPKNDIERHGVSMITAAVVERAGATVLPTEPPSVVSGSSLH
jgi:hypothetical protein